MEINITRFFHDADPSEYSASIAETGLKDIGKRTWNAAKETGAETPLLTTPEEIAALRLYVKDFGAWSEEEIAAWDDAECNALFIQLVSGDMRDADLGKGEELTADDWAAYEERAHKGQCAGNIFRADNGEIYYSLSR